jgi:hypothetical protein
MLALQMWIQKESNQKIVCFIGSSVLGYVSGMVSFKLLMMNPNSFKVSSFGEIFPNFWNHLLHSYMTIGSDFKIEWCVLMVFILTTYVIAMVRLSERSKIYTLLLTLLSLVTMGALCFGIYPIFAVSQDAPRTMYGFCVGISLIGIKVASPRQLFILKVPAMLLSWSFFVFAFTYGNALVVQKEYEEFRVLQIVEDLAELECLQSNTRMVQLSGSVGYAPVLRNMPQDYQMMKRLVPVTVEGGYFGWRHIDPYYNVKNVNWIDSVDLSGEEFEVLKDTMYHTIRGNDTYISVELK